MRLLAPAGRFAPGVARLETGGVDAGNHGLGVEAEEGFDRRTRAGITVAFPREKRGAIAGRQGDGALKQIFCAGGFGSHGQEASHPKTRFSAKKDQPSRISRKSHVRA